MLIHHPEWNSTLILRSETLSDTDADFPTIVPELHNLIALRNIHRKLLPRRPGRDSGLEQHCTIYGSPMDRVPSTLVLTPILDSSGSLPYYHPTVSHIAFLYRNDEVDGGVPRLQIEVVPFEATPLDINSRLYRTCLALLETLHRYGWGATHDFKKRVHHDQIIPRDEYQVSSYRLRRLNYF